LPASDTHHERPAFERALAIARRHFLLLVICLVTVPAVALIYSLLQTKEYTASASLLFGTQSLEAKLFGFESNEDPQRVAATNIKLVSSDAVSVRTAKALDLPGLTAADVHDAVSVTPEGESELIAIEATDTDPELAARIANEFAGQYIDLSRDEAKAKIEATKAPIEIQLEEIPAADREGTSASVLERKIRQLDALKAIQTGKAELVQPAIEPTTPSSPKTTRNVALGILLGILLGIALALGREQFDRRLHDLEEVEEILRLPVLGTIPRSRAILDRGAGAELAPTGAEGEAFRMLRASLHYFNVDRTVNSILVTSAAAQDGKTTVAWNLAQSEARAGTKVLFIEADLRRPTLAKALGLGDHDGLSLVLAGISEPKGAVRNTHGVDVLTAGPLPPNPAELIESKRMDELLKWAEGEYERVIVDTPPSAVVADAVPLFSHVGGVAVVVRLQKSPREPIEHLKDQLTNTGAPVLGIIVNGVEAPTNTTYYRGQTATGPFAAGAPSAQQEQQQVPTETTDETAGQNGPSPIAPGRQTSA
jgi:capsular exopolysaccharide synthesis family protein